MTASRPHVTVLAGFSAAATEAVARSLLVTDPSLILITHDLTGVRDGIVRRTVRTADQILEEGRTEPVHGCVSCTLRADVIPTLVRPSHRHPDSGLLLALPPAIEPEAVAGACALSRVDGVPVSNAVHVDSYVTVVEAAGLLDELTSTAIGWESTGGGVLLSNLGPWLATLSRKHWNKVSELRRLAADAAWNAHYGDRTTALSFVGFGLDVDAMTAMLRRCLLTDAEIAEGADGWHTLPGPFAGFFPVDEHEQPAVA